ncbi:MAG: zinc-dependent metalloprotease family protein [Bacteroidota bacterium]
MMKIFLPIAFLCGLVISGFSQNTLFTILSPSQANLNTSEQEFVDRMRLDPYTAQLNLVSLGNLSNLQQSGILSFLMPNSLTPYGAEALRVQYEDETNYIWTGRFPNQKGSMSLVRNPGGFGGFIDHEEASYTILPINPAVSAMIQHQTQDSTPTSCGVNATTGRFPANTADECNFTECTDIVDVLLLWTPEASDYLRAFSNPFLTAIVGTFEIEAMNIGFANSGLEGEIRVRAVDFEMPRYDQQLDMSEDVQILKTETNIDEIRAAYGANLVVLLTNQNYQNYGIVDEIGPDENKAYAIVEVRSFAFFRWTLAHELGHLFGGLHQDDIEGPQCAHAYRFTDNSGTTRNTLVASVNPNLGVGQRILYYSNPNIQFGGVPAGVVGNANVAGRISNTTCEVANFLPPARLSIEIGGLLYFVESISLQYLKLIRL